MLGRLSSAFLLLSFCASLCLCGQWSSFSHGSGPTELIIWQPYAVGVNGGAFANFFLSVANRFVTETQVDGKDTFTVRIVNADWGGVAAEPLCQSGLPSTRCPDIIMLGTTQLAWRVQNGDLIPLDSYFANFSANLGHQFQDDFLRVRVSSEHNCDFHVFVACFCAFCVFCCLLLAHSISRK